MRIAVLMIFSFLSVACSYVDAETDAEWQAYRAIKYNDALEQDEPEHAMCNVHHTPLVVAIIAREAGMCVQPPRRYVQALVHEFPHSAWNASLGSESCGSRSERSASVPLAGRAPSRRPLIVEKWRRDAGAPLTSVSC